MIAHGIILSGLTQLISQVKQITSIIFLLPFTSAMHRAALLRPHLSVIFPPKQQKHSRQLPFSLHVGSILAAAVLQKSAGSVPSVITLCIIPHGMQHKSLGFLKTCHLESSQHRACRREAGVCCTCVLPFCQPVPPPPADDGICARRPSRVLGPAPPALWQCRSFFPSQQRELPGTSPDVTLPQIKKQK